MRGVRLIGSGSSVPDKVMTNDDLAELVDTSDEWITTRTGIKQRRIVDAPDVGVATLAADAGRKAIAAAGITAQDLDLIVLATSTPDDLFGTAAKVQELLGAERAVAFDISAACSGFVFGLVTAAQFLRAGTYQNILLIGADVLSRWVNWSDRGTCILFGDGAGAVVMQDSEQDRLLGFELRSDGRGNGLLNLSYDRDLQTYAPITMNGKEVYKFAVTAVPEVLEKALHRANLQVAEIDWLILHQANQRILDAVQARMGIEPTKVVSNLANYGNTSAASIPLALDEWVRAGKIKPGDAIATSGFGAGLSWGAAIFRWH
ncbi:beta-ketoacyl-ACP synthase III [Pseudanabaena sp. PCC 6802]|uniref:beta-ketoacyl-ACP synthase III n=1 Tax=Pseudanabaena sp. PCC 6802 TaxID=118173 RepID=UPI000344E578|nr:beta-ketoacyl-ACP synthase III [Pseudanabaena sp. PCC 6802]